MPVTRDKQDLFVNNSCSIVSLDDDGYVESSTLCIYVGSWTRDNRELLEFLPPACILPSESSCSGMLPPAMETMYRFTAALDPNQKFDLLKSEVAWLVIKDSSKIKPVIKMEVDDE